MGFDPKVQANKARGTSRPSRQASFKSASANNETGGLESRDVAVSALFSVFVEKRAFDDVFNKAAATRNLEPRDRAFARLIAATVLRHHGELRAVIARFLEKPLPEHQGRLEQILLAAAAQLLFLQTPPHAAISLAVDQCRGDSSARRFDKLTNAVLRRVSEQGFTILAELDAVVLNIPPWLFARWERSFGLDAARAIGAASLQEAPLDLTVKSDPALWAERLGGIVMPSGSVRLTGAGRIEDLEGYDQGAWWVQDTAAALPVKMLGDVAGLDVADLCAAPGGKTAQLAASGANVTAVDKSPGRLNRLKSNLVRLNLSAETFAADADGFAPGRMFDAILVDAPCTATGTVRRHPDILLLKRDEDVAALGGSAGSRLGKVRRGRSSRAAHWSIAPARSSPKKAAIRSARFLPANPGFRRIPVDAQALGVDPSWLTADGDLQTLPSHAQDLSRRDARSRRLLRGAVDPCC